MKTKSSKFIISSIVILTYIIMVAVNGLANTLPINGIGTGEVSDSYPNLFAPIGLTFAIWAVIYILLLIYTIHQFIKRESYYEKKGFLLISILFSFSSLINTVWIYAWHYEKILLSLLLMIMILLSLITINFTLMKMELSKKDLIFVKAPFAVYFGWITIATIANVTTYMVSINWNQFGLSELFWTNTMILAGALIGFLSILFYKSFSYGIVLIWAYLGIALKHISSDFFSWNYPSVVVAVVISIIIITIGEILLLKKNKNLIHDTDDMLKSDL